MAKENDNKILALNYIKDQIITCAIPPGATIQADEIAAHLRISKTPVREALLELQYENYVTIVPRKKTVVSPISLKDLEYIYEARSLNEIAILSDLTSKDIDAHRKELEALKKQWESIPIAADNKDAYINFLKKDTEFHIQLVNLSQNPHLIHFCSELIYKSQRFWYMALFNNSLRTIRSEHLAILTALLNKHMAEAANDAKKHISISKAMSILSN
ncbi:MAG: GntR family transcriptional regulator [Acidaminococcaceae bacterium]|jgi:DNA-binding GntR family transcriptional regulator|nr:GntR family transcriptional regulator [Acidaminococcaceae bacterium]MCI2110429.1 GntR family transcriptional regulator [Acidaminococcaceae bacterium]